LRFLIRVGLNPKPMTIELRQLLHRWVFIPIVVGSAIGLAEAGFVEFYQLVWAWVRPFIYTPMVFIVVPVGLFAAFFISVRIGRSRPGSTTHDLLNAFHFESGKRDARAALAAPAASAITMGFGGSAGLEGPSLSIGGSVAYRLGDYFGIKGNDLRVIFLAGAGSALGAVLKAPLTGILFAIEVPYRQDLEHHVFLPAVPMAVVSYLVYTVFLGQAPIFSTFGPTLLPTGYELLFSILEGFLLGGLALAFIYVYDAGEKFIPTGLNLKGVATVAVASVIVAALGYLNPMSLGVGYSTIKSALEAPPKGGLWEYGAASILLLVFLKIITTSATLDGGGSGGMFIPSVFVGAVASIGLMKVFGAPFSLALVASGAAAVVAATNKTPLAAVAFAAEAMTTSAIIPALVAVSIAYILTGNRGFYSNQLDFSPARTHLALLRVSHVARQFPKSSIREIMRPARFKLEPGDGAAKAFSLFSLSGDTALPVVSPDGKYMGRVELEDLVALPHASAADLMVRDAPLNEEATDEEAVGRVIQSGKGVLFVASRDGKLMGVVRTRDLIRFYAGKLASSKHDK